MLAVRRLEKNLQNFLIHLAVRSSEKNVPDPPPDLHLPLQPPQRLYCPLAGVLPFDAGQANGEDTCHVVQQGVLFRVFDERLRQRDGHQTVDVPAMFQAGCDRSHVGIRFRKRAVRARGGGIFDGHELRLPDRSPAAGGQFAPFQLLKYGRECLIQAGFKRRDGTPRVIQPDDPRGVVTVRPDEFVAGTLEKPIAILFLDAEPADASCGPKNAAEACQFLVRLLAVEGSGTLPDERPARSR